MAPSCSMTSRERWGRMSLGAGFVVGGFLLNRDAFTGVALVTAGSAIAAAAALGY